MFLWVKWDRIFEIETVLENCRHVAPICKKQAAILKVQCQPLLFLTPINVKQQKPEAQPHPQPDPNLTKTLMVSKGSRPTKMRPRVG